MANEAHNGPPEIAGRADFSVICCSEIPGGHVNERRRASGESNQNSRNGHGTRRDLTPLSSKVSNRSSVHGYTAWGQYRLVGKEREARKTQIQYTLTQP